MLQQFHDFLRQRSLRATEVRDRIARLVLSKTGHFDVDQLVHELRQQGIQASRATVYRTLPLLRQAGIVQSIAHADERRQYEATAGTAHHDHLICTSCGRVVEFQFEAFEILQREVARRHGFELVGHSHELFGLCQECRQLKDSSEGTIAASEAPGLASS